MRQGVLGTLLVFISNLCGADVFTCRIIQSKFYLIIILTSVLRSCVCSGINFARRSLNVLVYSYKFDFSQENFNVFIL